MAHDVPIPGPLCLPTLTSKLFRDAPCSQLPPDGEVAVREVLDALTALCLDVTSELAEHFFDELDVDGDSQVRALPLI